MSVCCGSVMLPTYLLPLYKRQRGWRLYVRSPLVPYTGSSTHLNFDLTSFLGHNNVDQSVYINSRKFSQRAVKQKTSLLVAGASLRLCVKQVPRRIWTWRGQSSLLWCVSPCLCSCPAIRSKPGTSSPPGPVITQWVAPLACCPESGGRLTRGGLSPKRQCWTAETQRITTWLRRTGRYPSSKAW